MLFLHTYLLAGLAGIAIPVIIHLFNRRSAREVRWGAMQFLLESMRARRRSMLLEEMLLLATRALVVACAVVAMARPFVPAGSAVPWWLVLPLLMLGVVFFGASFALGQYRWWQWGVRVVALVALLGCGALIWLERNTSAGRFGGGEARDIALVIDGSSSMTLEVDGESNFSRALREVATIIEESPRGVAFSLLVAGAVTDALVPAPVGDRKYLLAALERAVPVHGVMQMPATLAEAAASLAQGNQIAKQIIVVSDGQSTGWQLDDLKRWGYLDEALGRLPSKPQVFVRVMELPEGIRNLTLKGVSFSRPVIGTDRSVRIEVAVVNNGVEAVTPTHVAVRVEGEELVDRSIGQMAPGSEQVVTFMHRFKSAGAQVVEARIEVEDDLVVDNTMRRVVQVVKPLKILVVDDGRGASLLSRAGGYVALGLMPSASGITEGAKGRAGDGRFLMQPELMTPGVMSQKGVLSDYAVVVLADLAALSEGEAQRVADFVEYGGSLLVLNGLRSQAEFYNGWRSSGGQRVVPLALGEAWLASGSEGGGGVRIDPATFSHPALALFKSSGDLADVVIESYRKSLADDEQGGEGGQEQFVAGRLMSGEPVAAERALGKGRVMQMCLALDRTTGSLVSSQSFLPLVQELTAWLAQPVLTELNIVPARGAVVQLSTPAMGGAGGSGLLGEYYKRNELRSVLLSRVDPTLHLTWGNGAPGAGVPADNFVVRWSGVLTARLSGEFVFHLRADDRLRFRIGTREGSVSGHNQRDQLSCTLVAGERYPIEAEMVEESGEAGVWVEMEGPRFARAPLPSGWLSPRLPDGGSWGGALATRVVRADGVEISARLRYGEEGMALRTERPLMQGLYRVEVPAVATGWLGHLLGEEQSFPLCVMEDPEESRMERLSADERRIAERLINLTLANSLEELVQGLRGRSFGRELWRIPAVVLLVLLLLEVVLTRWIFVQRKGGQCGGATLP